MAYRIVPRRFRLIIDPVRYAAWKLDSRLDFRRLRLAVRYIDQCNSDWYQGHEPGELRCIGFDSTKRGQTIIEFEEAFALPMPALEDSARFSELPAGRWEEVPATFSDALEFLN